MSITRSILQVFLFAFGPFYGYPWKPFLNAIAGDTYAVSLKHFKAGHFGAVNLALHSVCLFVQVLGNFGFLLRVDNLIPQPIGGVRLLSALTAISWSGCLLLSPAPKTISLLSTSVLAAAYYVSPFLGLELYEKGVAASLIIAFIGSNVLASKRKVPLLKSLLFVSGFAAWYALWAQYRGAHWGEFKEHASIISRATAGFFILASLVKNPLKPIVVIGTFLTRFMGIAAGDETLYFLGHAFFGSLCQGVAHAITREEATLLALERNDEDAKIRHEYAHVTFFPNILLQTISDFLFNKKQDNK